ncbi:hypothetical protein PGTUg99_037495 [Puccinia graminis f. sp. tritici]|uniref:ATP-dependent DNA ligase family profile domain-containing protein n=1 Tax=Puccinia graminis f. sp. tritici TaxID=56615 RepID=A0A5B0RAQ1_PUCGR|nr:hypothetical protein PGTUg99_037495 [Puccinia graminis f. sp. tritici]
MAPKIYVKRPPTAVPHEITFATFCMYLDKIASRKPRKAGTRNPATYDSADKAAKDFETWINHLSWPVPKHTGKILFRLLFPDHDVRRKYDIREKKLAGFFRMIFHVSTGPGQRGEMLKLWDSATEDQDGIQTGKAGCLGLELQKILEDVQVGQTGSLKLSVVDRLLEELAARSKWSNLGYHIPQDHSHRSATAILYDLYAPLSPRESAYMTQIILKDLRPLLYPIPSLSVYISLMDYDSTAFKEISPYCMMKAWHWAMPRIYRAKADFDVAADLCERIPRDRNQISDSDEELLASLSKPQLGTLVNIPKTVKASGPCLAAPLSKLTGQVWAETKMDGERMQIHIDTSKPQNEQIKILSKSHRDSTSERAPTHSLIRAALGFNLSSAPEFLTSTPRPATLKKIESGIFEAEMVAWNLSQGHVDEFWRIREMKLKPWQTHTERQEIDDFSSAFTESQIGQMDTQQLSDLESRHLALCFFDVLYLNGQSLLERSYNERRHALEKCIHVIPHYSMLVERKSFDLSRESGKEALRKHYAAVIAERHEGLVLKTAESVYNDSRTEHKWLKVKKDFIQGFGDTADYAIIGASWDQNRGRELGVPTSTYVSWYVGLCDNTLDIKRSPGIRPHFQAVFTSLSYGLSRQQLEQANRTAKEIGGEPPNSKALKKWSFTYKLAQELSQPAIIFKKPLVFELMGSGFTKRSRNHEYELRWPRIMKFHDPKERDWTTAIDLETHDEMAKRATDPKLLGIADIISGGSQEEAANGFRAELEHWDNKLKTSDLKWLSRGSKSRSDSSSTQLTAPKPVKEIPSIIPENSIQTGSSKATNEMDSSKKKPSKTVQRNESSSHVATKAATSQKGKVPMETGNPDNPEIILDEERPARSRLPPSKEIKPTRKQPSRACSQATAPHVDGIDPTKPLLKRKASGSMTTPAEIPLRGSRLATTAKLDKAAPGAPPTALESKDRTGPNVKRQKTSEHNPHSEALPDKANILGPTAEQDIPTLPKSTSSKDTNPSVKTSEKSAIPMDATEIPTAKRTSTLARVQSTTSSAIGLTPKHRDFFAYDLLDIEKEGILSCPDVADNSKPVQSPAARNSKLPDKPLAKDSSIPTQTNRSATHVPASDRIPAASVSTSGPGPSSSLSRAPGGIGTSTGANIEQPGPTETATDGHHSAPPWHQRSDIRWCLVQDEQTYGIQGTRYGSVNQLLRSLEIDDKKFDKNRQPESFSYIFIENPSPEKIQRIQKQILFRPLSDPTVDILGYDAKVLTLQNAPLNQAWKSFELFRFNSYTHQFDPVQTI